jgi:hypothetical protein
LFGEVITMGRFILRYEGRATKSNDSERIRAAEGVKVVDQAPKMFLVEASAETIRRLAESLPDWICTQEVEVPLPDPRRKLRKP